MQREFAKEVVRPIFMFIFPIKRVLEHICVNSLYNTWFCGSLKDLVVIVVSIDFLVGVWSVYSKVFIQVPLFLFLKKFPFLFLHQVLICIWDTLVIFEFWSSDAGAVACFFKWLCIEKIVFAKGRDCYALELYPFV